VSPLTGTGAVGASSFAAAGGSGGNAFNAGLPPSNAGAVANPIATSPTHLDAGNAGVGGTAGSGGSLAGDAGVDADGGTANVPIASPASPLLNPIGTNPLFGSAGGENSGNGAVGRLGAEASTIGGQEGSGGEAGASGDAGAGGGGATGAIGGLRQGQSMGG
jgi:hypothetical protein